MKCRSQNCSGCLKDINAKLEEEQMMKEVQFIILSDKLLWFSGQNKSFCIKLPPSIAVKTEKKPMARTGGDSLGC